MSSLDTTLVVLFIIFLVAQDKARAWWRGRKPETPMTAGYELVKDALGELAAREDHDVHFEAIVAAEKIQAGRRDFTAAELYAVRMASRVYGGWLREQGRDVLADELRAEQYVLDREWRKAKDLRVL